MSQPATRRFADRRDAGARLARRMRHLAERSDVVVLALPRGGVPVAYEVARALRLPLDVFVVRKLGVPGHEELAMGAVASGGVRVLNEDMLREFQVRAEQVDTITRRASDEVARRERAYRCGRAMPDVHRRTVLLIDDGIATGATMVSAVRAVRRLSPASVIVAAPVIAESTREALLREADDVICLASPETFFAVGVWYDDFAQTTDAEVIALLADAQAPAVGGPAPQVASETVAIAVRGGSLFGDLSIPPGARGLVIFAHGSGSSRSSPRNREVASELQNRWHFATLLFDLLTPAEDTVDRVTGKYRFDIELLTGRLIDVTDWALRREDIRDLPIGYFGASTGAAAALTAAAERPGIVQAVVSRGGRPDLAGASLGAVTAATLFIVGGNDPEVQALNAMARLEMHLAPVRASVVAGATHLFEEPGALAEVTRLAGEWFTSHLVALEPAGGWMV